MLLAASQLHQCHRPGAPGRLKQEARECKHGLHKETQAKTESQQEPPVSCRLAVSIQLHEHHFLVILFNYLVITPLTTYSRCELKLTISWTLWVHPALGTQGRWNSEFQASLIQNIVLKQTTTKKKTMELEKQLSSCLQRPGFTQCLTINPNSSCQGSNNVELQWHQAYKWCTYMQENIHTHKYKHKHICTYTYIHTHLRTGVICGISPQSPCNLRFLGTHYIVDSNWELRVILLPHHPKCTMYKDKSPHLAYLCNSDIARPFVSVFGDLFCWSESGVTLQSKLA